MKRTIFLLIFCVFAANIAQAQRNEVRRAERQLSRGILNEAMQHIDAASQDPSTSGDPATWMLKTQIYTQLALTDNPEYKDLVDDPIKIADEAAMKALELEPSSLQQIQIQQMILVLSELTYNAGVEAFNEDNFNVASRNFLRSFELTESQGTMDTTTLYNAGLAAELGRNYAEAKKIYSRLIDMQYSQPYLFSSMSNISMAEGDTVTALKHVLKGREAFPDDLNIMFNEANIYIFTGQSEQAKNILSLAIDKDPENPSLHFALAANFDRMAQDTMYVAADRKSFFNEAEKYYKQAIALDEDYFDAIYNIGVLYFNEGVRLYEIADLNLRKTQNFNAYTEDEKVFNAQWLKSQPYFEKARKMINKDDPYFETVIISLMQMYMRTNQLDKYKEVETIYHENISPVEDPE